MPRIILRAEQLDQIQQQIKEKRGMDFNTTNEEAVFSMLKYWCREAAKGKADVETVTQKEDRFLVEGNSDFISALQTAL
ncbi:MAG: hypothetical protein ACE10D_01230 [Planctomycetota bacterium]|nr:hypothetical protein [Planctomycetota bacterium]